MPLMLRAAIVSVVALALGTPVVAQRVVGARDDDLVVLFDLGHNNGAGQAANANVMTVLEGDGYDARTLSGSFTRQLLADVDLVVITVPLADENALKLSADADVDAAVAQYWRKPVLSAFAGEEIDVLDGWVRQGGGLLVVVDHFPTPGAVAPLLSRFGIDVSNGFAVDSNRLPSLPVEEGSPLGTAGEFVFDRTTGTLADHSVTNGRDPSERVDVVGTFVGSAFHLPDGGESLMTFGRSSVSPLPDVAWEFSDQTPRQSIAGWSQGGLLHAGAGRVAVFGELGVMATGAEFARNHPEMQNPRLLFNTIRWLLALNQ